MRRTKRQNARFGRYPSCDMINNAIRYLLKGESDKAIDELVFAIGKADGYFYDDVEADLIIRGMTGKARKPKTHGDELRSMNDEDLARFFMPPMRGCPPRINCRKLDDHRVGCGSCWLNWLQTEVDDAAG